MEDSIRNDLKLLCYDILENYKNSSLSEQLTQVQMLYERLLVINYLAENDLNPPASATGENPAPPARSSFEPAVSSSAPDAPQEATAPAQTPPPPKDTPPTASTRENPAPPPAAESEAPAGPAKAAPAPEKTPPKENDEKNRGVAAGTSTFGQRPEKTGAKPQPPSDTAGQAEGPRRLNDRLAQGSIEVGLNDRIAFVKRLFEGSQADFNRVLSQLNGFDSLQEAENFLLYVVKPEYNWEEESEYEERLLELIRKRFGEPDA